MTWRAIIPNTQLPGKVFSSIGDGTDSGQWGGATMPEEDRTFSVSGPIAVASGATNYLPPFFKSVGSGSNITLIGVHTLLHSGSATISINQNGSAVSGLSAVSVSTTASYTAASTAPTVADGDYFAPVVSSVSGSPDGLSVTFVFAVTV